MQSKPHFHFAWSLASEEQFYVFWPLALVFLRARRAQLVLVALICLKAMDQTDILRFLVPFDSLPDRVIANIPVPICLGVLLGCTLHEESGFWQLYPILSNRWSSPLAVTLLVISLMPSNTAWQWCQWFILTLLVGACVIREDNGMASVLNLKILSLMGVVSYGMYLFNPLLTGIVRNGLGRAGLHHPALAFPFVVVLTFLVARISYTYYEERFLRLKGRWAR